MMGRAQELGNALDESESLPFNQFFGTQLAVVLVELGLVIEEVQLRRSAGHEQEDDVLGFRCKVRRLGKESLGRWRGKQLLFGERSEGAGADAESEAAEEMAAGD